MDPKIRRARFIFAPPTLIFPRPKIRTAAYRDAVFADGKVVYNTLDGQTHRGRGRDGPWGVAVGP